MTLKNDQRFVVKQSDKFGACVILDSKFYNKKMLAISNDKDTYKKLVENIDNAIAQKILSRTKVHHEQVSNKEKRYLTCLQHKTSQLHVLPSVHESKLLILMLNG